MKATLVFSLPDEREEYESAYKGARYSYALEEIDLQLRNMSKYEDKKNISIEEVRKLIRDCKEACEC